MSPADRPGRSGTPGPDAAPAATGPVRRWRLVRASREAVPPSVRRFMRRARRRRLRAALPFAVTGLLLALVALGGWVVYGTSVLGVAQVRVTGTSVVTPDEVRAAAAVPSGVPLARVDLDQVAGRVAGLLAVERAVVSRDWPGTLVITVVERVPAAVVPREDGFLVVDAAGVGFRTVPERPGDLAVVRVTTSRLDESLLRDAVGVLGALTAQLRESLVELLVAGPARIELRLVNDRVVIWGDATDNDVKARVADALLARPGDVIDVSAPDVVTIR
ncbi:FtsQ-type POTRA domain-containing protein [Solwaraspora sp. WMMD406]|uniref:cell division protein FtsQ/DivIB n=1 Tax=Solwaraspora sp. WMMD406 TaxID=3016095 RepID=UPI002416A86C|nr:FtsQ-type POTRA domain-containing protein [Solwaraspora sp. WMMD406]MDG4765340.1 FtsQ-type POTRA domain-containing protein [Solwaraspora sp. WMMD406]